MAHQLIRIREKLCNTPHLIQESSFEAILSYIDSRMEEDFKPEDNISKNSRYSFNKDIGVAVLNIDGPLTYKPVTMMGFDCGGTSYEQIKEDFTYLVDSGAKTIAFSVSSGGGEAFQMMPTARYLRKLADDNNVKIISFVEGLSASAAYGLTSISDEIVLSEGSEVGSIGVLVRLMNDSKALEKEGYERTFITAGAEKVPFEADGSFRKEFIEDIQDKVNTLYIEFTEFVAEHRNISVEAVRATQAKTFLPERAIELGLADKVMSIEDFYDYLADMAQRPEGNTMLKTKLFNMSKEDSTHMTTENVALAELQAQLTKTQSELSAAQLAAGELANVKEALATLQANFTEKETQLVAALAQVGELQAEKEQVKTQARKDKLAAVLSADKVDSVSASLSSLDDDAFATVLAGFAQQKQTIEASDLMNEIGGEGGEKEAVKQDDAVKLSTEAAIKQRLGLK